MDNPRTTTLNIVPGPAKANLSGNLHGGELLKYLDQLASATSRRFARGYTVTARVGEVDFLEPIRIGDLLTMTGTVTSTGTTSMVVSVVVESENLHTGDTTITNRASFTMVHTVDGIPTPIPTLVK